MPGGRPPRDASELGARWGSVAGNGLGWGRGPRDWGGILGSERRPQNGEGAPGKGEREPWVGEETQTGRGLGNVRGAGIWGEGCLGNTELIPWWGRGLVRGGSQNWGGGTGNQGQRRDTESREKRGTPRGCVGTLRQGTPVCELSHPRILSGDSQFADE